MSNIPESQRTVVVIIGAGVAGLAAAKTLTLHNIPYIIVEAQNYVGGRVKTIVTSDGIAIDLGAQYIHGEDNNIVYELCKQLDCVVDDEDDRKMEIFLTSEGKQIDPDMRERLLAIRENVLARTNEMSTVEKSFGDFLRKSYESELSDVVADVTLHQALIEWFIKYEEEDKGCQTLNDLSLADFDAFEMLDGNYMNTVKCGFQPFIDYLSSTIPKGRIQLNSEVTKVEYRQDKHVLVVDVKNLIQYGTIQLLCEHIIWTTSIGYLKENFAKIFATEPKLIKQKQAVIDKFGFGTVNKVLLVYPRTANFWPSDVAEISFLRVANAPITLSSEQLSFLTSEKVDPQKAQELIDAIIYARPSANLRVISLPIGGSAALIVEDMTEAVLCRLCHDVICHYLKKAKEERNRPMFALKTDWQKNRFTRGSYSFFATGSTRKDQERLRQAYAPDGIPRITFAGEATHARFFSTLHGAFESGRDAAQSLATFIRK